MSECLIYQLKLGETMVNLSLIKVCVTSDPVIRQVGHVDSQKPVAIRLSGETIREEHCYFDNKDGKVVLCAMPDSVTVRGVPSSHHRISSDMDRRSSMGGKSLLDRFIDSDQAFESFSEITTFSDSTTPKKYGSYGVEPPTSLRPFNAACLPLTWSLGTVRARHGRIHRQGLQLMLVEMASTGHLPNESTPLPG
jgi:hypothetical protein